MRITNNIKHIQRENNIQHSYYIEQQKQNKTKRLGSYRNNMNAFKTTQQEKQPESNRQHNK